MKVDKSKSSIDKSTNENIIEPSTNSSKIEKKKGKKIAIISICSVLVIGLIIELIVFLTGGIPSKYRGTYVRYYYFDGIETKVTYKISSKSIKATTEYEKEGKKEERVEDYEYYTKDDDLIIKDGSYEKYLIIDDDCLYIETSKDISTSKQYGSFFWNVNSNKADIYEIKNKAESVEDLIETTMNTWARKFYYKAQDKELKDTRFYILSSDEKTDETNLNTYEVKYKVANGDLSFYYNRKSKTLERIYFSGSINTSSITGKSFDSMSVEDTYDAKAMLLSLMYIYGNENNVELNINIETSKDYDKVMKEFDHRDVATKDYDALFSNKRNSTIADEDRYSLDNDKYSVEYTSMISSSTYSVIGMITFNMRIK